MAKAGAAGLAAVERFVAKKGYAQLSSSLVETLGQVDLPATRALLSTWLADKDFPWPPQALRALARIATVKEFASLLRWSRHPAHVRRAAAMQGLGRILAKSSETGHEELLSVLLRGLKDPHVFVRATAAAVLLPMGMEAAEAELRQAALAQAMWFGANLAQPTRRLAKAALRKAGLKLADATPSEQAPRSYRFGLQIVSCVSGDVYVRLDAQGRFFLGVYQPRELPLKDAQRQKLLAMIAALPPKAPRTKPRIYCDSVAMRGFGGNKGSRGRWAPGGVPEPYAELVRELQRLVAPLYRYRLEIGRSEIGRQKMGAGEEKR